MVSRIVHPSTHNRLGSIASLARTVLSGVDQSRLETSVQTQSLILMLTTLIDLCSPDVEQRVEDTAVRSIASMVADVKAATKERDEADARRQLEDRTHG